MRLEASSFHNPVRAPMKWFGDPLQPRRCIGDEWTQRLADWGDIGRQGLHHEYCEYTVIHIPDSSGRLRPKRVQVTTELREYWVCVAIHDPHRLSAMAQEILGREPSWEELYGIKDPFALNEKQREIAFSTYTAGHGNDNTLINNKVPSQPIGKLNTEQALFMKSPINGLDDLMYIVVFGAKPYGVETDQGIRPATRDEILHYYKVEYLACHHADPNVVLGGQSAALEGRTAAFDNPMGIYLRSFAQQLFRYQNAPVPDRWIRWSRGMPGMYQRLEFGPDDEEEIYLDDISIWIGANKESLTGGYQLLRHLEIGPLVLLSEPSAVDEQEWVRLKPYSGAIHCVKPEDCLSFRKLILQYEAAKQPNNG
ncbi:hypothetical protein ACFPPD_21210 [Cohnella suwonensis]|uniref:Uncharacterized protein n=1 Tax=Cohnella suwonensis TaxID=696072 RepID=A0ABW0M315_9BACL